MCTQVPNIQHTWSNFGYFRQPETMEDFVIKFKHTISKCSFIPVCFVKCNNTKIGLTLKIYYFSSFCADTSYASELLYVLNIEIYVVNESVKADPTLMSVSSPCGTSCSHKHGSGDWIMVVKSLP